MEIISSSKASSTSLAPGFRFHPTDEELVFYYLRRKICGKSFRVDAISEIYIYKVEPWDLPGKSKLKTRDKEWYFFSMLDKKYGGSQRTNRATEKGYWKTTGKDRAVYHRSNLVGMKKTLVYHCGRAPRGERSNWVMHEYRLMDEWLAKAGFNQDSFVLCRVFQKSGAGPKNGEQYGAPLIEEEWENEEFELSPKKESGVVLAAGMDASSDGLDLDLKPKMEYEEEVDADAEDYLDGLDLEQIIGTDTAPIGAPRPLDLYAHNENSAEDSTGSTDNNLSHVVGELQDNHMLHEMPHQYGMEARLVKHEYIGESNKAPEELDFLLDEPFWDAAENHQFYDGSFLDTNDLFSPIAADTCDFADEIEDFLVFDDANDGNNDGLNHVNSENSRAVEGETFPSCETSVSLEDTNVETQRAIPSNDQLVRHEGASSSTHKEHDKSASVCQYPFLEKASQMLGSIPAPPAFASEFPAKGVMKHLSLSPSPNSVHVTAGIIHIRSLPEGTTSRTSGSFGKDGSYNVILSLGLSHTHSNAAYLESSVSLLPEKFAAASSYAWFYSIFYWLLLLSLSFKLGTFVCVR
ncbi:hypothetical protein LIER_19635 [Lithospermum erythrorhizon]|uniref:NAC domain-containing protein n=1 Tax=Lithospermum erythrorhizon TaxID=34254 RepID=A0AAV3QIC8_LITER